MAELDFDAKRAERGATESHVVRLGGEAHELPPVLPMEAMVGFATVFSDLLEGEGKGEIDMAEVLPRLPELVEVFATVLGDWVRQLDMDEFMEIFALYDLGVRVGEAPAS